MPWFMIWHWLVPLRAFAFSCYAILSPPASEMDKPKAIAAKIKVIVIKRFGLCTLDIGGISDLCNRLLVLNKN